MNDNNECILCVVAECCQKTHEYMDEADNILPQYQQIANALKYVTAFSLLFTCCCLSLRCGLPSNKMPKMI